jgi:hypothetical protein
MSNYTNIGSYTDDELIVLAKETNGYKFTPTDWWVLGFRSKENTPDVFDDKFYIFYGSTCIYVMTGTTNSGVYGLLNFKKWTKRGVAQIKADEWYYNVWSRGLHNGKMPALRQTGSFKVIRDADMDLVAGNSGDIKTEVLRGLNFHTNTYRTKNFLKRWFIGKWSVGCQVTNDNEMYYHFLNASKPQNKFSYCLIQEK